MADPVNPYAPSGLDRLSLLLMSLGSGISGAEASGRSGWAGLGPAAAMYGGAMSSANQNAAAWEQQQRQFQQQESYRKAQEDNLRSQISQREAEGKAKLGMSQGVLAALGVSGMGAPNTPTIGPGGDYFSVTGGAESGNNYRAVNGMGSGAFGKYQFTPDTWASVATQNPQLGLPFNMRQATDDQQEAAMRALTESNARALQAAGIQPTNTNLYLAHRFGAEGAKTVMNAPPGTAISSLFPPIWTQQNPDMRGATVDQFRQTADRRFGGAAPPNAGGQGDSTGTGAQPQLDPQTIQMIRAIAIKDPEAAAKMLIQARQGLKKDDAFYPLSPDDAKMFLGQAYNPSEAYQRNRVTGKIERIGGSLVNINNAQESEMTKAIAKQDAERLLKIQENAAAVNDTANKVRLAADLFKQTYTGAGGDAAQFFFKTLGSLGVESAANKANAATAATALVNEMMPRMRAPGSGATSDFEMRTFASALPSLLSLPDGNEMIATYWQRIADRALAVQSIAEKHVGESKALTGTKYAEEVKALGPIFTKEELAQMQGLAKAAPKDRPPLNSILNGQPQMTPMPDQKRPPLGQILGR